MDRRLLHHDGNVGRLKALYDKDELIREFGLETMRDYLARVRRDRQLALKGLYRKKKVK
jgi:hypothetical protein